METYVEPILDIVLFDMLTFGIMCLEFLCFSFCSCHMASVLLAFYQRQIVYASKQTFWISIFFFLNCIYKFNCTC